MATVTLYIGVQSTDAQESLLINESGKKPFRDDDNGSFLCPRNHVLIGRWHKGDENGGTRYKHGELAIVDDGSDAYHQYGNDYEVVLSDVMYSNYMKESDSEFPPSNSDSDASCVLVGREHTGDENGKTRYAYKKIYLQKKGLFDNSNAVPASHKDEGKVTTKESGGEWAERIVSFENSGITKTYYAPMYKRTHKGDENADTHTYFSLFMAEVEVKNEN